MINFICSLNEKPLLEEHSVKEILISCKSLNYYETKNFKTVLPQVSLHNTKVRFR